MCLGRQKERLRKGICGFLLLFFCFSPQIVMSIELEPEIPRVHYENAPSNSLLLQEASFLALDHYSIKMVFSDENLLNQTKNRLPYENPYGEASILFMASSSSRVEASIFFKKVDVLSINPLVASLHFPPLVHPPEKSSLPDPFSLLMLSLGATALLVWSRRKRHFY